MIRNYIKIAFRNLFKNKVYSSINIFGLAIGIACCLLIGMYVINEWSYDTFHSKSDRIYRAWVNETTPDGREILNTATPVILGPTLKSNIPEIEHLTYLYQFSNLAKVNEEQDPLTEQVLAVNDDFFEVFDFKIINGNRESLFSSPSSVVLSKEAAERYFGNQDPIQQVLSIRTGDEYRDFTVTSIIENPPSNSSIRYSVLIPYRNLEDLVGQQGMESWFNIFGSTYLTLSEGTDPQQLDAKFAAMMEGALGPELYEETNYTVGLQPLTDIHLNTELPASIAVVTDPAYSYILAAIALLVLLIACVNFMTLSISRSTSRAKEVGIRKTIGAVRQHLMYQFWGESLLMSLLAMGVGITFAEVLLPFFNDLSQTTLQLSYNLETVGSLLLLSLFISLIAGIYPALILSGFRPVEVLKGRLNLSGDKGRFQQFMVVFQFSFSIVLIIGTITIYKQLQYVQNKNLGYQEDQVLQLESGYTNSPQVPIDQILERATSRKRILETELSSLPEVQVISTSSFTPVQTGGWFRMGFYDAQEQSTGFHANFVDADFIPALGITMIAGRNFSENNPSDARRAIIVNEAAVEYFGWENPIGQRLSGQDFIDHEVIGVVENFHYESLHTPIEPLILAQNPEILLSGISNLNIRNSFDPRYTLKFSTGNLEGMISSIQEIWQQVAPEAPFNYTFIDEVLDTQYRREQRLSRIVATGATLAIIIACLGLFGLASLMVVRRTKEIGVRKVLGASASSIVLLVNKEFTQLVAIAFVIAAPIAWYTMSQWLQDFAYRIDPGLGLFALAGLSALVIALLTVSYQSVKATLINPVESLKSE